MATEYRRTARGIDTDARFGPFGSTRCRVTFKCAHYIDHLVFVKINFMKTNQGLFPCSVSVFWTVPFFLVVRFHSDDMEKLRNRLL
jgi:hypothetical protein